MWNVVVAGKNERKERTSTGMWRGEEERKSIGRHFYNEATTFILSE